jgi:hypothetical protein
MPTNNKSLEVSESSLEVKEKPCLTVVALQDDSKEPIEVIEPYETLLDASKDMPLWSHHGEVASWLSKAIDNRPPWAENDCASMIRAIGYFEKIDKYLTQALRTDINGAISPSDLKNINDLRTKLHKQLKILNKLLSVKDKKAADELEFFMKNSRDEKLDGVGKAYMSVLKKKEEESAKHREQLYPTLEQERERRKQPQSENCAMGYERHCEAHNVPLYDGQCLICEGEASGEEKLNKVAYTPKLTFVVDPFINFVCRQMINAKVSSGKNINEVYATLKSDYSINKREEAMILSTLQDMGYPVYMDLSGHSFLKNYYASLEEKNKK